MLVDGRFSHLGIVTNGDERLQEKKRGIMLPKKKRACLNHYITATTELRASYLLAIISTFWLFKTEKAIVAKQTDISS